MYCQVCFSSLGCMRRFPSSPPGLIVLPPRPFPPSVSAISPYAVLRPPEYWSGDFSPSSPSSLVSWASSDFSPWVSATLLGRIKPLNPFFFCGENHPCYSPLSDCPVESVFSKNYDLRMLRPLLASTGSPSCFFFLPPRMSFCRVLFVLHHPPPSVSSKKYDSRMLHPM